MSNSSVNDFQKLRVSGHWDSLKRFDSYITATNFKCGLLTTLNAAILGGITIKLSSGQPSGTAIEFYIKITAVLISLFSVASIIMIIRTIKPRLGDNNTDTPPSLFFFNDIAKNRNASEFHAQVINTSIEELEKDLCRQVYEVAVTTSLKMQHLADASKLTIATTILTIIFCTIVVF
tara:strand:- start:855 stop:1385 length:531 start_codon:yes stop_codon:yes gene_type:complete